MAVTKVSTKGQIVIPAELRDRLGLRPGALVRIEADGKALRVTKETDDPIAAARGLCQGGRSLTAALLKSRRGELAREEGKRARPRRPRRARLPR